MLGRERPLLAELHASEGQLLRAVGAAGADTGAPWPLAAFFMLGRERPLLAELHASEGQLLRAGGAAGAGAVARRPPAASSLHGREQPLPGVGRVGGVHQEPRLHAGLVLAVVRLLHAVMLCAAARRRARQRSACGVASAEGAPEADAPWPSRGRWRRPPCTAAGRTQRRSLGVRRPQHGLRGARRPRHGIAAPPRSGRRGFLHRLFS
mmetsp:Transcript_82553/g.252277  ORF Transcript_82553/g.252277 Transcript_82553/m.252277 type:complete len:208 (-) Transcript_82553:29-652(-)